jgi:hypothetical protein
MNPSNYKLCKINLDRYLTQNPAPTEDELKQALIYLSNAVFHGKKPKNKMHIIYACAARELFAKEAEARDVTQDRLSVIIRSF